MYITYDQNRFSLSGVAKNAVAEITPPLYLLDMREYAMPLAEYDEKMDTFRDGRFSVKLTVTQEDDTLFCIRHSWQNISDAPMQFQTVLRVRPCFAPTQYLIPCVNINGNPFGNGGEPKGLERDGQRWIFAYDREAIPACTVTENADFACSLFSSAATPASLQSSCSIWKDGDTWYQEILRPVIEAPLTYCDRDRYAPAYQTYITLQPGEEFETESYLVLSRPRYAFFGICDALDHALTIFGDNSDMTIPTNKQVWDRSITFAKSLISHYGDKKGFIIGWVPDGNGGFVYRSDNCFELAWCGQNILFSRLLVEDYIRFGHKDSLDLALEILDTRAECCTAPSGLLAAQLCDWCAPPDQAAADTCNMGYGAYEYLRVYGTLAKIGIDKPAYLSAGLGLCNFFCNHLSPDFGCGKVWRLDGVCLDQGGTIGAFVIPALTKAYELTRKGKYLACAEQAMEFYVHRDLDRFCCTAGALDTCCVDKETSTPFIIGAIALYKLTGKQNYLEYATKAAYYFVSWMFHYQPVYGQDTEMIQYGITAKGLTSVSAQHHHLDNYGAMVVPYLRELATLTGDARWQVRADMMWRAVLQFIGDGVMQIHGVTRPVGSQNEALFHCRWGFSGGRRGTLNDWLVAWPCAFRLSVLAADWHDDTGNS